MVASHLPADGGVLRELRAAAQDDPAGSQKAPRQGLFAGFQLPDALPVPRRFGMDL